MKLETVMKKDTFFVKSMQVSIHEKLVNKYHYNFPSSKDPCSYAEYNSFLIHNDNAVYSKIDKNLTFKEAYEYCSIMGSNLPSFISGKEEYFLSTLAQTTESSILGYWLGAHKLDENDWFWLDKSPTCASIAGILDG